MKPITNPFKAALQRGEAQIGLWLGLADACVAELCAGADFDWLMIDAEHSPNDVRLVLAQLQAVAPYRSHAIVRPPIGRADTIKRYLDIGVQTLLIPMVDTAEQAATLAAAVAYPPAGSRGVSTMTRAAHWGRVDQYLATARDGICLLVQVETPEGIAALDAIAETAGVDGIFIGPNDLAAGMGSLGSPGDPAVQAEIEQAIARVRAAGKPCGILAPDEALARRYLDLGCTFVAVGADGMLLRQATDGLRARFADIGGNSARATLRDRTGYIA